MNVEELRPHLPAFLFCGWRKKQRAVGRTLVVGSARGAIGRTGGACPDLQVAGSHPGDEPPGENSPFWYNCLEGG